MGFVSALWSQFYSQLLAHYRMLKNFLLRGFLGGSVVQDPPANAEDMGLIPDLGRSWIPDRMVHKATKPVQHKYWPCALEAGYGHYWSPGALEPALHKERHCSEKPASCKSGASPARREERRACAAMETQHSQTETNQLSYYCFEKNFVEWISRFWGREDKEFSLEHVQFDENVLLTPLPREAHASI